MVILSRPCKAKNCGQIIRWHNTPGKRADIGYYVNDDGPHKDERHLCPQWNDIRSVNNNLSSVEDRMDCLQRAQAHQTSLLQEIKMKIDAVLQNV